MLRGEGDRSIGETEGGCEMERLRRWGEGEDLKLVGNTRFHETTTAGYGIGGGRKRNE